MAFSRDGVLLAASGGGQTRIFRVADGRLQATIAAAGNGLTFSPDRKYLAMALPDRVTLSDTQTGFAVGDVGVPSDEFPHLAFDADGLRIGIAARSGGIWEWNVERATATGTGEIRRRVCMDSLRYAGGFTTEEMAADSLLASRPEKRRPCRGAGPLAPAYYADLFTPPIEARSPLEDTWPMRPARSR
jgi:hypothetical protein